MHRIEEHLFGAEREMPDAAMRVELAALQGGVCVYTGVRLPDRSAPIDHVVPWARVRISSLGNFVVTTRSVNSHKRELMLAYDPLKRWVDHLHAHRDGLARIAEKYAWPDNIDETRAVAARLYRALQPGAVLWAPAGARPARSGELDSITQLLSAP